MNLSTIGLKTLAQVKNGLISGDWGPIDLDDWLLRACINYSVKPEEFLIKALSDDDIMDILENRMPYETLTCYVKTWVEMSMPDQVKRDKNAINNFLRKNTTY
jgi:hypothetical protein